MSGQKQQLFLSEARAKKRGNEIAIDDEFKSDMAKLNAWRRNRPPRQSDQD